MKNCHFSKCFYFSQVWIKFFSWWCMDYTTFGQKTFGILTVVQKTFSLTNICHIYFGINIWATLVDVRQTDIWTTGIMQAFCTRNIWWINIQAIAFCQQTFLKDNLSYICAKNIMAADILPTNIYQTVIWPTDFGQADFRQTDLNQQTFGQQTFGQQTFGQHTLG